MFFFFIQTVNRKAQVLLKYGKTTTGIQNLYSAILEQICSALKGQGHFQFCKGLLHWEDLFKYVSSHQTCDVSRCLTDLSTPSGFLKRGKLAITEISKFGPCYGKSFRYLHLK